MEPTFNITREQIEKNLRAGGFTAEADKLAGLNAGNLRDTPSYNSPSTTISQDAGTKALDLTASISGLESQRQSLLAQGQKDYAKAGQDRDKAQAESDRLLSEMRKAQENRPSSASILQEQRDKYQVDASFNQINSLLPEITSLRDQLNQINTDEAMAVENLKGQGRGIPMGVLGAQEAKIVRTYAIRKNAVAGELNAKAATMESLRGNITLASQLAKQAVDAKLYDIEQKVQDYKDLYTYNAQIISSLDAKQKSILDRQYNELESELKVKREEMEKVAQLMVDNPTANVTVGDSLEEAARKVKAAGGSLANRQEERLLMQAKADAAKKGEENVVTLYQGTIKEAIDGGATPQEAVLAVVSLADSFGTKLTVDQQTALFNAATRLQSQSQVVLAPELGGGILGANNGVSTDRFGNPIQSSRNVLTGSGAPKAQPIPAPVIDITGADFSPEAKERFQAQFTDGLYKSLFQR